MNCSKGCCSLKITHWDSDVDRDVDDRRGINTDKAGVLLYDQTTDRILVVQSRGNMWGIPKGTRKRDESFPECAIREVLEETGIEMDASSLDFYIGICDSRYFIVNHAVCDVEVQEGSGNDANGIGWIRVDCLLDLSYRSDIKLTSHTSKLIEKLFKR